MGVMYAIASLASLGSGEAEMQCHVAFASPHVVAAMAAAAAAVALESEQAVALEVASARVYDAAVDCPVSKL